MECIDGKYWAIAHGDVIQTEEQPFRAKKKLASRQLHLLLEFLRQLIQRHVRIGLEKV